MAPIHLTLAAATLGSTLIAANKYSERVNLSPKSDKIVKAIAATTFLASAAIYTGVTMATPKIFAEKAVAFIKTNKKASMTAAAAGALALAYFFRLPTTPAPAAPVPADGDA